MRALLLSLLCGLILSQSLDASTSASEAIEAPGIKRIQLVTDSPSISPGEAFTVALVIEPLPGYHTYWKGPGIVGVATTFEWDLPPGFAAGEVIWPAPQKVDMAGITAYGYKSRVMLLTEIQSPEKIDGQQVTIRLKSAWMACSQSCNPGVAEFSLSIPVALNANRPSNDAEISAALEVSRLSAPASTPHGWVISPSLPEPGVIHLDLTIPGLEADSVKDIYFFCHDMQVDSNADQRVTMTDPARGIVRLTLVRPDFAPATPAAISGVIFRPGGWPGTDNRYVEISSPWPGETSNHEQP